MQKNLLQQWLPEYCEPHSIESMQRAISNVNESIFFIEKIILIEELRIVSTKKNSRTVVPSLRGALLTSNCYKPSAPKQSHTSQILLLQVMRLLLRRQLLLITKLSLAHRNDEN